MQGTAFQLSLWAQGGVGGDFSGGTLTLRRQNSLSLEGWDQEVGRLTGRNLECPAGPGGSPPRTPWPQAESPLTS